jgi:translation initiation factor IF-2
MLHTLLGMNNETPKEKKTIEIPNAIIIKDLAKRLQLPVTRVIAELMKNGVMSSMNERIDYETAAIISEELGFAAVLKESDEGEKQQTISETLHTLLAKDSEERKIPRPPVVVVMGHVDHGKTKLLDAIRKTDVVAGESGGITQHIGAYQVQKKDRAITFIDTPGHEAFTAMRSRGARVADIAILVVAADDGIKPQTKEAIQIIRQAQIPFCVAINKIDKPEANVEKIKRQLSEENILTEDWGGKIPAVPVSAATGEGVDDLLETVVLLAQMEEASLLADPTRPAVGSVIEAHIDKGEGPVATVIIQTGTLRVGESIRVGGIVGKIKALQNWHGKTIEIAEPSQPVKIHGLKHAPEIGDILEAIEADEAKRLRRRQKVRTERVDTSVVYRKKREEATKRDMPSQVLLNVVLRCDNLGSQEAIIESLQKYESSPVRVEIVTKGLGSITEADVLRAATTHALLLGFHVLATPRALEVAKSKQVEIQTFTVIYDLLNYVQEELENLLPVETSETLLGHLSVIAVFRKERNTMIVGGPVTDGSIQSGAHARILRAKVVVGTGMIQEVQIEKRKVSGVQQGTQCGIRYAGEPVIAIGDSVECFTTEEHKLSLKDIVPDERAIPSH